MSSTSTSSVKEAVDAAQKIVGELTGMTSEHQSLAIKFACETLGLQFPPGSLASAAPSIQSLQHSTPHVRSTTDHSADIRSFTAMKSPKSDQQFAAVVAYFYQFEAKPADRKDT